MSVPSYFTTHKAKDLFEKFVAKTTSLPFPWSTTMIEWLEDKSPIVLGTIGVKKKWWIFFEILLNMESLRKK